MCATEDRRRFGECYWHRVHQVPGVEVCPIHEVSLENSSVHAFGSVVRYEHVSAEYAIEQAVAHPLSSTDSFHGYLLDLARDAAWLLTQHNMSVGPELLHQIYNLLLMNRDLAVYASVAKTSMLLESFTSHYPPEFLTLVQCEIDEHLRQNWLSRFLRAPLKFQHPLRHLLLMHFLGHSAETFFQLPTEFHPFGDGPWPCLNRASPHYGELRIQECQVTHDRAGLFRGIFSCSCGFIYVRRGPDQSTEDQYRVGRYESFGYSWEVELRRLWENPKMSPTQIGKQLGVDRSTVIRQAARLGLSFPPPGAKIMENSRMLAPPKDSNEEETRAATIPERRKKWLSILAEHPEATRVFLGRNWPTLYAWLRKNDLEWLEDHLPPRRNPIETRSKLPPPRVDWAERDEQLVNQVRMVAQELLQTPERPLRISVAAIAREIRQLHSMKSELDKLPLTSEALAELVDTTESFYLRRIEWATKLYHRERICPTRTQFMTQAGFSKERLSKQPRAREAFEKSLQALAQYR